MSSAGVPASLKVAARRHPPGSPAPAPLLGLLWLVGILAVGVFGASLVPGPVLAEQVLGATSVARGGVFTQELVAHLDERLRLAAGLLLVLAAGLAVFRVSFEDLVKTALGDFAWPGWPTRNEALAVGLSMLL